MLEITVDGKIKPGLKVEGGTVLYSLPWDGDDVWCVQWNKGGWDKVKIVANDDEG